MKKIKTDSIAQFKMWLTNQEKSLSTIDKYLRDVKAFKNWCGERLAEKTLVLEYKKIFAKITHPQV